MSAWPAGDGVMAQLIRDHQWDATALGPIDRWPQSLKSIVNLMLHSPSMMSLVWGADAIHLYNDAFMELLQEHRIRSLGRSAFETFARSRNAFKDDLAAGMAGRSARLLAKRYPVLRDGRLQDAWFDVDYAPVHEEAGGVGGVLWTLREVTPQVQAGTSLRESEKRYRSLFNSISQGLAINQLVRDETGRVIDARYLDLNPAYETQTGFELAKAIGLTASEVFPAVGSFWLEMAERVVETGKAERAESFVGDTGRWYAFEMAPFEGKDQFVVLYDNITDRKQAEAVQRESEKRQAFLLDLSDALRPISDAEEIQKMTARLVGEHLAADRSMYGEVKGEPGKETGTIRGQYVREAPDHSKPVQRFPDHFTFDPFGAHTMGARYRGEPLVVRDVATDPSFGEAERAAWLGADVRAAIVAPLAKEGRLVAEFGVHCVNPRDWTDDDVLLIQEVAERTWAAAERARAEAALRASEEKYRTLFDSMDEAYAVVEVLKDGQGRWADFRFLEVNPAFIKHTTMPWPVGKTATELLGAPNPRWAALYGEALDTGKPLRLEEAEPALGLTFDLNIFALDRERNRVAVLFSNITERKKAEAALRESEERFSQFAEAAASGLWIRNAETLDMEFASPAAEAIYGVEASRLLGDVTRWASLVVPEDRADALRNLERTLYGEITVHEFRIQRPTDQTFRWIRNTNFPLRADGRIARIGGIAEDVTEAKLAVEHQGVLLAELQHRVRNIMGMIRSLVSRSADGASSVADYRASLAGRLLALARVQAVLTRQANAGGSLRDIIESEIAAQAHHAGQYLLKGPDVMLAPKAVEVLTLAFHELATNALKYGGLSVPEGRILVRWEVVDRKGEPWLELDWREEGAPPREPSSRRGFGSELIELKIPYELRGRGKVTIENGRAHCRLEIPLRNGESILETDAPTPVTIHGGSLDMNDAPDLAGQTILVVEDDYYMASDVASALRAAGADVLGPCPTEEDALTLLERQSPTAALLDLNLGGGGPRFEIARQFKRRDIPFVFLTGYDQEGVPDDFQETVRLQKPVALLEIVRAVAALGGGEID